MTKSKNYLRTIAEYQFYKEMISENPTGILSLVSDTFNLFDVITEFLPRLKDEIMSRDGKLVIRPDSGDPVDILCGYTPKLWALDHRLESYGCPESKGVIELLWDLFGGTINEQGYKVLDPHIGAIYGDSITLYRQIQIYERLAAKGFAATNIVLGVGSYTYQMNTRDTFGFAAKGAWFEANGVGYDIYKDPVTDDGTKKSLKGLIAVEEVSVTSEETGKTYIEHEVHTQCSWEEEETGLLHTIYENGNFFNQTTLTQVREKLDQLVYSTNSIEA